MQESSIAIKIGKTIVIKSEITGGVWETDLTYAIIADSTMFHFHGDYAKEAAEFMSRHFFQKDDLTKERSVYGTDQAKLHEKEVTAALTELATVAMAYNDDPKFNMLSLYNACIKYHYWRTRQWKAENEGHQAVGPT